jgi:hypothetical protein
MKSSDQQTIRSLGSPSTEDWWNSDAGDEVLILEDPTVRAVFDAKTGAWIDFQHKPGGWKIQQRAELGQPFRAYAAWKDHLFNPVSGLKCRLRDARLDSSARRVSFEWDQIRTSGGIELEVSLLIEICLEHGQLTFSGYLQNASDATVTTLSWPILGDLIPPSRKDFLCRENLDYGTMKRTPLWPRTANERGERHPLR